MTFQKTTVSYGSKPSSKQIRQAFLDFFASKGHQVVASSSLVPHGDPTLLFTNAGMNQFKDVFLGFDKRAYTRAASSQKCVRAGGKHNDLENVGYTARHHTFFEMLGNFSFGDYFKRDAITFAWELLTQVYALPKERLMVTVYAEDDEAYDIWNKEIGVPADKIVRIGDNKGARYASDNFWMMGDTGPCGPCTEIFYDHGDHIPGGPPGSPDEDGDRFIEIWNNVFMQFNRDEAGVMHPLPKPSVDTGMGLERISAVLQGVHANYEIDLFQALIKAAARETKTADLESPSLKVLADHIRACSFLIADGVIAGNEGRGYVLRRIIRRAIRHGYKLGCRAAFFHKLVADLVLEMGEAYPELISNQARITQVLKQEEDRFFETIENGMQILETELATKPAVFNGDLAFKLHDTFGFPLDLTADICRERGVTVDTAGFDAAMARQKDQARAAGKFKMALNLEYAGQATSFHGYEKLETPAKVLALYKDGSPVKSLNEGDLGAVVLDDTPFYAESGGQIGDSGELKSANGIFEVEDTQKIQAAVFGHHGVLKTGTLSVGDALTAKVNLQARHATMRNHSATHLMHKALREVLGEHVQQKGSLVDTEKTRFDFVHNSPVTDAQIAKVEALVNAEILTNTDTLAKLMDIEAAQQTGAMMLFGEKYGDEVRVLDIGTSRELCGGTHVSRTGDIGLFKITSESGVAAGVRRIEATTGEGALKLVQAQQVLINKVAGELKAPAHELPAKISQVLDNVRSLEKELARLKSKLASAQGDDLVNQVQNVDGVNLLAATLEGADANALRETMDKLKDKLKSAVIVLASVSDGKVSLAAGVTADLIGKLKAGELVNHVAGQVGGKGGGKPDMAMAGGTDASKLPQALSSVPEWVKQKLH
ncbi:MULTISPECIES: alanine--tRNA ligase [unclassified Methylophilus]|uniref:alanine--tRNA ligase n=1 Tax=unclassified Methylophilus TaxID=2630143 RepID=UPI0006F1FD8D|nr:MULTISPECIES: alanine--tRNA ligase [unclassified Methylophilus]KQT43688.1 alanine--tRNA ligase [Methylophilus sp. Leaf416]KQT59173.1 alanine--tRNA ligase [Methylophilus sp. Leaf459]